LDEADVADSDEEEEEDDAYDRERDEGVLKEDEIEAQERVARRHEKLRERLSLSADELAKVWIVIIVIGVVNILHDVFQFIFMLSTRRFGVEHSAIMLLRKFCRRVSV
jgi:hypothetical protein